MKKAINQYFNQNYLDFYQRYLPDLKKAGKEYKAQCPFHEDTDPSLAINNNKGLFHCFGCKAEGDIFKFYAMRNGLSLNGTFPKVCRGIADEFNIPVNTKPKPQDTRIISVGKLLGLTPEDCFNGEVEERYSL
jgi:DNA primase